VLPSVGDKNALVGICSVSEYFPSGYYCDIVMFVFVTVEPQYRNNVSAWSWILFGNFGINGKHSI